MTIWPQILIIALSVVVVLSGIVRHGKPLSNPTIHAGRIIWMWFTLFAILGAGGFWKPLGW